MFTGILPHDGYFYPRSPCGERHLDNIEITQAKRISIHALLAESDAYLILFPAMALCISIHALLAESDVLQS